VPLPVGTETETLTVELLPIALPPETPEIVLVALPPVAAPPVAVPPAPPAPPVADEDELEVGVPPYDPEDWP